MDASSYSQRNLSSKERLPLVIKIKQRGSISLNHLKKFRIGEARLMFTLRALLLMAFALILWPFPSSAEELTDVCLKSGIQVRARIETREGRFILYIQGSSTPSDMTGQIHSVGVPDDPVCKQEGEKRKENQISQTTKFGIRGSNTIGERLMPMLIEAYANKNYGAPPSVRIIEPEHQEMEIKRPASAQPDVLIDFWSKGSGTAPPALKDRLADIGMMSRRMKDEEAAAIKAAQNVNPLEPESGSEHVVALDGLAIILNPGNPIKKLSLDTVARIFSCEITNWRDVKGKNANGEDVSGPDAPISVHARDDKSGTFDTFKSVVLEERKQKICGSSTRHESSEALSAAVSKDLNAIGFIGFPYINRNVPLRILSPCGLDSEPENFSVKMETYPLARRLYLYTLGTPSERVVKDLVASALSDEAQKIVKEAGFIDQSVDMQQPEAQRRWLRTLEDNPNYGLSNDKEVPRPAVRQFSRLASGMQRTSTVFRFAYGQSVLDTLARQNVGRLASYLDQSGRSARKVLLVGFADSDGSWASNGALAEARAQTVLKQLRSLGHSLPQIQVHSMSYAAPVACNDSERGRSLNRRVEVWVSN